jgi:hypothetical protein
MAIGLPSVHLEVDGRPPADELVVDAADAFRAAGCLVLHDVIDVTLVESLRTAFLTRQRRHLEERDHPDADQVGKGRYLVSVRLRPPFADPRVYADPLVMRVVSALLGDVRLFAFGGIVVLPGATDQHLHSDGGGLFGDPALDRQVPPYAITAIVPLADPGDSASGTTQVWPGSHLVVGSDDEELGYVDPSLAPGSVLLMDYRLLHRGTANVATTPRAVLYMVYARPWFRDTQNFRKQVPLDIPSRELGRVPSEHRALFAGATPT